MCSIKWSRKPSSFQWPPNPVFKVTAFLKSNKAQDRIIIAHQGCGLPRRLGLEAVSRPIKASALVLSPQYSFNQHTILKSIDLQANISPKTLGSVSKPMDVSVLASVLESRALVLALSRTGWRTPRPRNWSYRPWYRSRTVRPRAHPCSTPIGNHI